MRWGTLSGLPEQLLFRTERGMNMKAVIRRMKNESSGAQLWETLRAEGWKFLEDWESLEPSVREAQSFVCLVATDHAAGAEYAKKWGLACVAYEPPDSAYHFHGVDMVAQELDGLNGECLCMVWKRHKGLPWIIARTERLILRESVPGDLEDFYRLYGGEGMTDYIPGLSEDREKEKADLEAYIRNMYRFYNYGLWTVIERDTGTVVGRAGLENPQNPEAEDATLELGYLIGKPWQGKGYGTEAAAAAAQYAFDALEMERLVLVIARGNAASRRVARRLSERFPGKIRVELVSAAN